MAALENSPLPQGVIVDIKGERAKKKKPKSSHKSTYKLRLQFRQKCPEASEVKKLHPAIKSVFVPHRSGVR